MVQSHSLASLVTSLGVGGFIASTLGPLSYTVSFLLIESCKITIVTFLGISNMSGVLQILINMDNQ